MGRRTLYGCNKGAFLVIVRTSTGVFQGRNKEEKDTKVAEDRESRENEGSMYGYGLEEILPVVIYLTNKYTSGESSSVPYEKAEMLMEAVLYCIRECFTWNTAGVLPAVNSLSARQAYDKGYEYVTEKVKMARGLYDGLITDFEDYGCLNYRKTVLEGFPPFS